MAPNPVRVIPTTPADQILDDDVDALDETRDLCGDWLLSLDREADLGTDGGIVYRTIPGGGLEEFVVHAHLGIPFITDLRDFEAAGRQPA